MSGFTIDDLEKIGGIKPSGKLKENVKALMNGKRNIGGKRDVSYDINASYRREIQYHNPKEPRVNVPWMIEGFKNATCAEVKKLAAYKAVKSLIKGAYIMNRLAMYDYVKDTKNKWKDRNGVIALKVREMQELKIFDYAKSYIKKELPDVDEKTLDAIIESIKKVCKSVSSTDADIRKAWTFGLGTPIQSGNRR